MASEYHVAVSGSASQWGLWRNKSWLGLSTSESNVNFFQNRHFDLLVLDPWRYLIGQIPQYVHAMFHFFPCGSHFREASWKWWSGCAKVICFWEASRPPRLPRTLIRRKTHFHAWFFERPLRTSVSRADDAPGFCFCRLSYFDLQYTHVPYSRLVAHCLN
jgi:hypothetical protein